jgi:hypothetical protein
VVTGMTGNQRNPEFIFTKITEPKYRKYFGKYKNSVDVHKITGVYLYKLTKEFLDAEKRMAKINELIAN